MFLRKGILPDSCACWMTRQLTQTVEEMQALIEKDARERLY